MTDSLLNGDNNDHIEIDQNKNYLEELVGDGKKFKSTEELAKGKYYADQTLMMKNKQFDDLKADYLRLREEHQQGATLKELIDKLQSTNLEGNNTHANNEVQQPVIDPKQIEDIAASIIQKHELTKVQQNNYNSVKDKLTQHYGSNYHAAVKQQIDDLGVSPQLFDELAKSNPKLLFRTLGLDQPKASDNFQSPPRTERRAESFAPTGGNKRTWSYYQKMKQENPKLYLDTKIQTQMMKDYEVLGTDFEDGDFHRFR